MFHTLPGKICTVGSCGMQQWHTSPLGMWISLMFLRWMNLTRSKYSIQSFCELFNDSKWRPPEAKSCLGFPVQEGGDEVRMVSTDCYPDRWHRQVVLSIGICSQLQQRPGAVHVAESLYTKIPIPMQLGSIIPHISPTNQGFDSDNACFRLPMQLGSIIPHISPTNQGFDSDNACFRLPMQLGSIIPHISPTNQGFDSDNACFRHPYSKCHRWDHNQCLNDLNTKANIWCILFSNLPRHFTVLQLCSLPIWQLSIKGVMPSASRSSTWPGKAFSKKITRVLPRESLGCPGEIWSGINHKFIVMWEWSTYWSYLTVTCNNCL